MREPAEAQYVYGFFLHPVMPLGAIAYEIVRSAVNRYRHEEVWTEQEFGIARDQLLQAGWEMHEIDRHIESQPEIVL